MKTIYRISILLNIFFAGYILIRGGELIINELTEKQAGPMEYTAEETATTQEHITCDTIFTVSEYDLSTGRQEVYQKMLPEKLIGMNRRELIQWVDEYNLSPTLEDMEKGFNAGTDDYMIKPINMQEMVFRVKALLRRSKIVNEKKLKVGDTILDYDALTIKINDNLYNMPPKEFYLIFKLLSSPNKIFTRIELMDEIWGMDTDIDDRTIDSHIKKLRRKFEDCSDFEIVTVRGLGYKSKINV